MTIALLIFFLFRLNVIGFDPLLLKNADRPMLEESLSLGTQFLLNHQKKEGNFDYMYDWLNKKFAPDDNEVRQAGALWGLALLNLYSPTPQLTEGVKKGLAFFKAHSIVNEARFRFIKYNPSGSGSTGTVALTALAITEFLRTQGTGLTEEEKADYKIQLDQYINFLAQARDPQDLWYSSYDTGTGKPFGSHSPYFDGESLLALIKAARYMDRTDLKDIIIESARAGYKTNITLCS